MTATPPPPPASAGIHNPRVPQADAKQLTRLRWAVRAVLTLGVAASIAANVLHARPNLISQIIAAWPPLALLLTVELISRVPADRRGLAGSRLIAAAVIASIAAWVSYWHMVGAAARYGETDAAASYLLPISVDGLVVVASISLVEIAGRIRTPSTSPVDDRQPGTAPAETPSPQLAESDHVTPTPQPLAANRRDEGEYPATKMAAHAPTGAGGIEEGAPEPPSTKARDQKDGYLDRTGDGSSTPRDTRPFRVKDLSHLDPDRPGTNKSSTAYYPPTPIENSNGRGGANPPVDGEDAGPDISEDHGLDTIPGDGGNDGEVPSDTAGAVAYWYRRDPSLHPADIATRISRSERTVRRYWPPVPRTANGPDASRLTEQLGVS
jgi:hypothetical protein